MIPSVVNLNKSISKKADKQVEANGEVGVEFWFFGDTDKRF
jgi:hypothetical protein